MSTLWEIDERINDIMENLVDERTGEINEDAIGQLEQLELEKEEKLEACGITIKNLRGEVESIEAEIAALKRRAEIRSNKIDRISEYVKKSLKGKPFETAKVEYRFKKSKRVEISDEALVPDEWCNFKTERKPVKSEIRKLLDEGKNVPGCKLVESMNLQIK